MEKIIAYCGLDCAECEAYKTTQANDEAGKLVLLEKWRVEYDYPEMSLESLTCDGCNTGGRIGGNCLECHVRVCGIEHGVVNCAYCEEYATCSTLQDFIANIPGARANLEAVRAAF